MTLELYPNNLLKKHLLNILVEDEDDFEFPDSFDWLSRTKDLKKEVRQNSTGSCSNSHDEKKESQVSKVVNAIKPVRELVGVQCVTKGASPSQPSEVVDSRELGGIRDGSVVVRCCHTRSRAQVGILGRLMVFSSRTPTSRKFRIMAVTTERKDGSG